MPLIEDQEYEKQLETIIGVRAMAAFALLEKPRQGFISQDVEAFFDKLKWDIVSRPRKAMEEAKDEWHMIPYGVVMQEVAVDAKKDVAVLVYQRPAKGAGESRLGGKNSIGFAGHVNLINYAHDKRSVLNAYQTCLTGFKCEMDEELHYTLDGERVYVATHPHLFHIVPQGLIYDSTDKVGLTHLGVSFSMMIDGRVQVKANDEDVENGVVQILNVHWARRQDLLTDKYDFENWSKFLAREVQPQSANWHPVP